MLGIVINILGLVVIIVGTILAYKTARDNGRNGVLWAFLLVASALTMQYVVPTIAVIALAFYYMFTAPRMPQSMMIEEVEWFAWIFTFGGLALSFVCVWAVMRVVSRLPEDEPAGSAPPPPPLDFGG
jgi:hypothetical protein